MRKKFGGFGKKSIGAISPHDRLRGDSEREAVGNGSMYPAKPRVEFNHIYNHYQCVLTEYYGSEAEGTPCFFRLVKRKLLAGGSRRDVFVQLTIGNTGCQHAQHQRLSASKPLGYQKLVCMCISTIKDVNFRPLRVGFNNCPDRAPRIELSGGHLRRLFINHVRSEINLTVVYIVVVNHLRTRGV